MEKRSLTPWRNEKPSQPRRGQHQRHVADVVYSPEWEALTKIKNDLIQSYAAPVPQKDEQRQAFQTYNIVREILDEFFRRAEADAANAPPEGDE
jgi:hypothetical protein